METQTLKPSEQLVLPFSEPLRFRITAEVKATGRRASVGSASDMLGARAVCGSVHVSDFWRRPEIFDSKKQCSVSEPGSHQ